MKNRLFRHSAFVFFVALLVLFSFSSPSYAKPSSNPFKVPQGLESKVNFWIKIYTEYSTDQVVIHDADNLDIIYEVVDFSDKKHYSRRAKNRKVKSVKNFYKKTLRKLARKKKNTKMGSRERRVYNQVKNRFWTASKNIRAQLGQKDRFREGLRRSGHYIDEMQKIFRDFGLPVELTALPHVESSFQIGAYSKSGAVGIWQFMRPTGRRFLKINYAVDERRDPILATIAAAKLLQGNYEELGNWPLAITAYNHGLNGMKRAKAILGSDDIVDVVNDYKSRRFGFASENFYAGFLAALEVSSNYQDYFPDVTFYRPRKYDSYVLPSYTEIKTLSKNFNLTVKEIALHNPALRPPVLKSEQYVPARYEFKVPKNHISSLKLAYSHIPDNEKFRSQKRTKWYRVKRGDSLSRIAMRFRTSVRELKSRNQLSRSGLIYPGQVLQLPGSSKWIKTASLQKRSKRAKPKYRKQDKVFNGKYKKVVVRKNDSLEVIGKRHNVSINDIIKKNSIRNRNRIFAGQVLQIPVMKDRKERIKIAKNRVAKKIKPVTLEKASLNKIELTEIKTAAIVNEKKENTNYLQPVSIKKEPGSNNLSGVIFVEVDETLGHYAEWSRVSASEIRKINGFKYGRFIRLNQKIKVPFTRVTPDVFFQKRGEYHKSIQEDFFANYKITKSIEHKVEAGLTVWEICNEIYGIPLWLLRRYNPDTDLENLKKGDKLIIPIVAS